MTQKITYEDMLDILQQREKMKRHILLLITTSGLVLKGLFASLTELIGQPLAEFLQCAQGHEWWFTYKATRRKKC